MGHGHRIQYQDDIWPGRLASRRRVFARWIDARELFDEQIHRSLEDAEWYKSVHTARSRSRCRRDRVLPWNLRRVYESLRGRVGGKDSY